MTFVENWSTRKCENKSKMEQNMSVKNGHQQCDINQMALFLSLAFFRTVLALCYISMTCRKYDQYMRVYPLGTLLHKNVFVSFELKREQQSFFALSECYRLLARHRGDWVVRSNPARVYGSSFFKKVLSDHCHRPIKIGTRNRKHGDLMSLRKNRPKCCPNPFSVKNNT
jgi:hypothetical protein